MPPDSPIPSSRTLAAVEPTLTATAATGSSGSGSGATGEFTLDGSSMSNRKKAAGVGGSGAGSALLSHSPPPNTVYELGQQRGAAAGRGGVDTGAALLRPSYDPTSPPAHPPSSGGISAGASSSSVGSVSRSYDMGVFGSSSSLGSSTSSMSASGRRRRRLPQSGLTLCGRPWLLGAEDMCLPACWASQFDLVLLVLACVSWRWLYTSDFAPSCSQLHRDELEAWVVTLAVCYGVLFATDIATMMSSLRSNMFKRNRTIVGLIYVRLAAAAVVIGVALAANLTYFGSIRSACPPSEQLSGSHALHRMVVVLFIFSLCSFLVFLTYWVCAYGFGPMCGKGGGNSSWMKHIRKWLFCYSPTPGADGRNVLESISETFTQFFAADRAAALAEARAHGHGREVHSVHVVPSDVLVGFALVEASQQRRQALGFQFLKAAPRNRWEPDAFKAPLPGATAAVAGWNGGKDIVAQHDQFQVSYGATSAHGRAPAGAAGASGSAPSSSSSAAPVAAPSRADPSSIRIDIHDGGTIPPMRSVLSSSSLSPDPVAGAERGLWETARALEAREAALPHHARPDYNVSEAARLGIQPALDPRDWQRIADAQHFSRFAEGSYGWPLYTWNNPGCLLTCRACRCCTSSTFDHAHMVGSGCGLNAIGGSRCCHWSLNSFLITTGVADNDVLYAHLDSSPIYYLTVDHHQQCLVICCRGTLSVADAVIDLDAQLSPLDNYGYEGGYTHTGILENALRLRDDLDERGHMARFLEQRPHYNICVVGHSLGAATAALLTLLLRERFDTGPPPFSTFGPLTPRTRNRLTCIAYGCPLLVSLNVAQSEFALRCMTSVVYNADVICRLSLASCALLKDQMIACYAVSSSSKFRILANSVRKRYASSFEPGADLSGVASPPSLLSPPLSPEDEANQLTYAPRLSPVAEAEAQAEAQAEADEGGETVADGSAGGDISGNLFLGSVSKALQALDVLPDEADDAKEAEEARHRRYASGGSASAADEQLLNSAANFSPPRQVTRPQQSQPQSQPQLQSQSQHHADGAASSLPSIPSVVVTSSTPGTAAAAAAAAPSGSVAATTSPSASGAPPPPGISSASSSSSLRGVGVGAGAAASSFTLHLRKCYLPGRIYHVLPAARAAKRPAWFGLRKVRPPRRSVVYPAAQSTFQEIVVSKTMFKDHMPARYAMDRLDVPAHFSEPTDEQETPEPSPQPVNQANVLHL